MVGFFPDGVSVFEEEEEAAGISTRWSSSKQRQARRRLSSGPENHEALSIRNRLGVRKSSVSVSFIRYGERGREL